MSKKIVSLSRFSDFFDTKPKESSLEEFMNHVSSNYLKAKTERYRKLLEEGKKKEAAAEKKTFPGVTMAGVFQGGRADKNLLSFSMRSMFDWDGTNENTPAVKELLKGLPYVETVWISVSGRGVKATVLVEVNSVEEYAQAYEVISLELNRVVGYNVDPACKNVGRYCSETYDPDIYYNPNAEFFPWREKYELLMQERAAQRVTTEPSAHSTSVARPVSPAAQGPGQGIMADFLRQFFEKNPFIEGSRHETMLKLGRMARCKNLSPEERESLVQMVVRQCAASDFTAEEIGSCIATGYQYLSEKPPLPKSFNLGSKVQGSYIDPVFRETVQEEQEEMSENSNKLRAQMPHFSQEVYEHLPDLLKRGAMLARSDRERDMLLMGMIAHLSCALPNVSFKYDQLEVYPHIYFAGVSHAGTGKGIVALAAALSKGVHDHYVQQGEADMKAYEERLRVWEENAGEQRKNHKRMPHEEKPEEPKRIFLQIPAHASRAMLYTHIRDNGDVTGIIHTSEIDALASAIGLDYGKQDDMLRAFSHHEPVSSSFKINGAPMVIERPRLALCLTGTPDQLVTLVKSQEDGLYSRLSLLTAETVWEWRSAAPRPDAPEYHTFFEGLGKEVLNYHLMMKGCPTFVDFTESQWRQHTEYFSKRLQGVVVEGEDSPGSVVLRHGLLANRLAAVFTALRKCEDGFWAGGARICTDEDFHTAMLMVNVLLEHSLLLSSSLPELALKALPLRKFSRFMPVLEVMQETFTYTEFVNEAVKQGLSISTGKRLLKKAEHALLVKKEKANYHKTE